MNTLKNGLHAFRVELYKGRHRKLGLVIAGFLLILLVWASYTHSDMSAYDRAQGYKNLFFEIPIMNCILMPIMLAVIASRLCDMEIKGDTFKLLYTLENRNTFFDCKFLHEFIYLFAFAIGETILFPLFGIMFHYTESLSVGLLLKHTVCLLIAGTLILTLQHILSLLAPNQMAGLFMGIAGAFIGLFSMFFPQSVTRFIPWAYFCTFIPYQMEYDRATRIVSYTPIDFPMVTFILFTLFTMLIYYICRTIFLKKEV